MTAGVNWRTAIIALLVIVTIAGGFAFMSLGLAGELNERRDVYMTVVFPGVHPDVATQVRAGDIVYTDSAAMYVGVIDEVDVGPMMKAHPDSEGRLVPSEDPLSREVSVVISTTGRETDEIIAIGNQVVQVGQQFTVFTKSYQLRGQIVRIDVR